MQPGFSWLGSARIDIPGVTPGLARLCFEPSEVSPSEARGLASTIGRTLQALRDWSSLEFARPFDVVLDVRSWVPLAQPLLPRPRIVLSPKAVGQASDEELSPDLMHELSHLLLFAPGSPFLSEGWAVACAYLLSPGAAYFPLSPRDDAPTLHHLLAEHPEGMRALSEDLQPHGSWGELRIREMPSERNRLAYARAGSFVLHLIEQRGLEPFTKLLRALVHEPGLLEEWAFERFYDCPLSELEVSWRDRLDRARPSRAARNRPEAGAASALFLASEASDWMLSTDGASRGGFTVTSTREAAEEVELSGRLAAEVAGPFVMLTRFPRRDGTPVDVRGHTGLCFEARGDGKIYQLCFATERARCPGEEFIHLLETRSEWTHYELPFSRFHRFVRDRHGWTGRDVLALYVRAFGYGGQAFRFGIRGLELWT
jgi:complex I intermediate-associated protein 30 (CIA30)